MILRHEAKLQKRISHSFAYNKQQSIILLLPACIAWRTRDYDLLTGFPRLGEKKNHSRCTSSLRVAEELKKQQKHQRLAAKEGKEEREKGANHTQPMDKKGHRRAAKGFRGWDKSHLQQ